MKRSHFAHWPGIKRSGLAVACTFAGLLLGAGGATSTASPGSHSAHDHSGAMDEAAMRRKLDQWFATHPRRGRELPAHLGGIAATFTASGFTFDLDGDIDTGPDTAKIFVGETVMWQQEDGIHSVTNGENSDDPNAGDIFNEDLDSDQPQYTRMFTTAGLVPFFCIPHEEVPMKGYVLVQNVTGVTPIGAPGASLGFVTSPAPNPSSTGFLFRFALSKPGRVTADAFDASGRRVASVFDRTLEPGTFAASWDGRSSSGALARPGTYFLRLRGPGFNQSRRVVVER